MQDKTEREFQMGLHGFDTNMTENLPGQPAVGTDPTQGKGTDAWQQALRMGLEINARRRRN